MARLTHLEIADPHPSPPQATPDPVASPHSPVEQQPSLDELRQDVLAAVMRELDNIRWRAEDPDGTNIWF